MSCDVGKAMEGLDVGEVTERFEKEQSCDVSKATEGLENEL